MNTLKMLELLNADPENAEELVGKIKAIVAYEALDLVHKVALKDAFAAPQRISEEPDPTMDMVIDKLASLNLIVYFFTKPTYAYYGVTPLGRDVCRLYEGEVNE